MKHKECPQCGRGFRARREFQKYCSLKCRNKYWNTRWKHTKAVKANGNDAAKPAEHAGYSVQSLVDDLKGLAKSLRDVAAEVDSIIGGQAGRTAK